MSGHYYRNSSSYRSRSPVRGRSPPPSIPQHQHYSPPPVLRSQHYSPPRTSRPRTPPRNYSSPTDRRSSDYSRYPDRERPTRSLPWQSQSSPLTPPPYRTDYRERDRYQEVSPRTNIRRPYDCPSSREETYYTQPQYPVPSQSYTSPASRTGRRSPTRPVIDNDTRPLRQPSPSFSERRHSQGFRYVPPRPRTQREEQRSSLNIRGSRESPICVDDLNEPQFRDISRMDNRRRSIRETGSEKLIHDEWRPPPRSRTPPVRSPPSPARRSWGNAAPRRQSSPARVESRKSPQNRREDIIPQNVRPERQESIRRDETVGKPWIHPERRDLVSTPDQRPPESHRRPDEQSIDVGEDFATQIDIPASQSDPVDISDVPSQTSSERGYEPPSTEEIWRAAIESLQEKDVAEQESSSKSQRGTVSMDIPSSLQMSNSRIPQVFSPKTRGKSSPAGPELRQPQPGSRPNEVNGVLSKSAEITPPLVLDPPARRISRWDQKSRPTTLEHMKRFNEALKQDQLGIKAHSQKNNPEPPMSRDAHVTSHQSDNQLNRTNSSTSQARASLSRSPLGERELNQIAKHTSDVNTFESMPATTIPKTITTASTPPPDLRVAQSVVVTRTESVGNPILSESIESSRQDSPNSIVKSMHSTGGQASPNLLAPHVHLRTPGSSYDFAPSRLATVDEVTAVTSKTLLIVGDKVSPRVDPPHSLRQDGILSQILSLSTDPSRKRGTSIASSRSSGSHNSRQSASPFLSALFTPGNCLVCSEKDRPCNRLARCSTCASLYHQSCHSPSLTKAVLEEAADNWICHVCMARGEKVAVEETASVSSSDVSVRRSTGLSVTLKRTGPENTVEPEKALEEQVMVNKSSYSDLLQRHAAQWKSPTAHNSNQFSPRLESDNERQQDSAASTKKTGRLSSHHGLGISGAAESQNLMPKPNGINKISNGKEQNAVGLTNGQTVIPGINETVKIRDPTSHISEPLDSRTATTLELIDDLRISLGDDTLQSVSPAEAVPSIKHPKQAIPASQSDSSQMSSNLTILEPESSPVVEFRRRNHHKRDLVISDSEEESSVKRMKFIPPRAAMKSAPSARLVKEKPAPVKLPVMSGSSSTTIDNVKKSSVVAKKSGTKFRESETPFSDKGDHNPKVKEMERERGNLRSPISPVMHEIRRLPRQASPMLARPTDPGESQTYSLQWVLSRGSEKNQPVVVDNEDRGFDYSTPYSPPQKYVQRHIPSSPKRKRSQDKKNFDVLSLVPPMAIPVLDDGKLAFREGVTDARTGHLKRGARKFKVGRINSGEIL